MINISQGEKRRHQRFPMTLTMDIQAGGELGRVRGTISDVSEGGLSLRTNAELEEGMCLHLKLGLPLSIRGEIRSRRGLAGGMSRYGIRFHKIQK